MRTTMEGITGMLTTDLALRFDPVYGPIAQRFLDQPEVFADAFPRAWFELTHRDMGPISRYLGPLVPREPQVWRSVAGGGSSDDWQGGDCRFKGAHSTSGLSVSQLVKTAWASASTFRNSDKRGGANGHAFGGAAAELGRE